MRTSLQHTPAGGVETDTSLVQSALVAHWLNTPGCAVSPVGGGIDVRPATRQMVVLLHAPGIAWKPPRSPRSVTRTDHSCMRINSNKPGKTIDGRQCAQRIASACIRRSVKAGAGQCCDTAWPPSWLQRASTLAVHAATMLDV